MLRAECKRQHEARATDDNVIMLMIGSSSSSSSDLVHSGFSVWTRHKPKHQTDFKRADASHSVVASVGNDANLKD